jgi:hypothetical protein
LKDTPEKRDRFLQICKALYSDLSKRNKGVLKCADKTGFSVPSVLKIMTKNRENPEIKDDHTWKKENLFNYQNTYLRDKIDVIAEVREFNVGTDAEGEFNPDLVAKALIGWVNGEKNRNHCQCSSSF